jgi:putative oxidoreductase
MFVVAGLRHVMIVPVLTTGVQARGLPFPRAVVLSGTDFQTWAALGVIAFTAVDSVMLVNFRDKQGEERIALTNAFQTNIGGLLLAATLTPAP